MEFSDLIYIRFAGSDITPGRVRSKEIAEVIEAIEDMLASIIMEGSCCVLRS